jgi:hypothetical protein
MQLPLRPDKRRRKHEAATRVWDHYILIRLSFLGGPFFLRMSWLAVDEKGAIRVATGEVGWFLLLDDHKLLLAEEMMLGRRSALMGIWNARANEAMMGVGVRCISRRRGVVEGGAERVAGGVVLSSSVAAAKFELASKSDTVDPGPGFRPCFRS